MVENVRKETKMMKYKVGDKVRIRKDLVLGRAYGGCRFAEGMQNFCGKIARITDITDNDGIAERYRIHSSNKYWTDEMFGEDKEKMNDNDSIRILVNGNKVTDIHMETGKRGVARCHPDDDFYTGAKLALERLEEMEKLYRWLKKGAPYYTPRFGAYDDDDYLWLMYIYRDESIDKMNIKRGIAFKTAEEAIACAKKMLAAVKREG